MREDGGDPESRRSWWVSIVPLTAKMREDGGDAVRTERVVDRGGLSSFL